MDRQQLFGTNQSTIFSFTWAYTKLFSALSPTVVWSDFILQFIETQPGKLMLWLRNLWDLIHCKSADCVGERGTETDKKQNEIKQDNTVCVICCGNIFQSINLTTNGYTHCKASVSHSEPQECCSHYTSFSVVYSWAALYFKTLHGESCTSKCVCVCVSGFSYFH